MQDFFFCFKLQGRKQQNKEHKYKVYMERKELLGCKILLNI